MNRVSSPWSTWDHAAPHGGSTTNNDRGLHQKIGKSRRELCGARGKVLPNDTGRRTFWKVRKEKRYLEMSQPDTLMGRLATIHFGKCARLSLAVQRYGWTLKLGEPTYGVRARNSCKHIVGDNTHQC